MHAFASESIRKPASPPQLAGTIPSGPTWRPTPEALRTQWGIQPKLHVNRPGDRWEQEADQAADQVMGMQALSPCTQCAQKHTTQVMRQVGPVNATTPVTRHAESLVSDVVRAPGQPLTQATRAFMEPRFGRDFSHVRVHADAHAQQSSKKLNARAYTLGNNIVFAASEYAPHTASGRHLLAHELTHVIQQTSGHAAPQIQREPEESGGGSSLDPVSSSTTSSEPGESTAGTGSGGAAGPEITLETGNIGAGFLNNLVHQQICVNGHGVGTGAKQCFSFAATGAQLPQFSSTWLGWSSIVAGAVLKGQVYHPAPVPSATVVNRHTPTAAQATNWLRYMSGTRLGLQDGYSVARHNCRTFSQWEFRDAPSNW